MYKTIKITEELYKTLMHIKIEYGLKNVSDAIEKYIEMGGRYRKES